MPRLTLDNRELTDEFFEGAYLLGIMAPVKDYQFAWLVNNHLNFDFRINHEIEIQLQKKQRHYFFSVFEYQAPEGSLMHYLYNNECDGEYLLPEFKHLDFLWLLKEDVVTREMLQEMISELRNIKAVQLVVELTNEKIKNKEHLVF